jgi:hypothetical protein
MCREIEIWEKISLNCKVLLLFFLLLNNLWGGGGFILVSRSSVDTLLTAPFQHIFGKIRGTVNHPPIFPEKNRKYIGKGPKNFEIMVAVR